MSTVPADNSQRAHVVSTENTEIISAPSLHNGSRIYQGDTFETLAASKAHSGTNLDPLLTTTEATCAPAEAVCSKMEAACTQLEETLITAHELCTPAEETLTNADPTCTPAEEVLITVREEPVVAAVPAIHAQPHMPTTTLNTEPSQTSNISIPGLLKFVGMRFIASRPGAMMKYNNQDRQVLPPFVAARLIARLQTVEGSDRYNSIMLFQM
jgi:hypothetical protein